jgi:hypothetical protein
MNLAGPNTTPDFDPKKFFLSLVAITKLVLLHPQYFFKEMKQEGGLRNPLLFLTTCVLIQGLLASLILGTVALVPRNLLFGVLFTFVTAGILFFLITVLFKAPGTYEMAFRVNAYAAAVSLFSWIPLIGMVLEFYRLYLIGVGLRSVFSLKASQAFLAIVLTLVLYIVASGALAQLTGEWLPGAG